MIKRTIPKEVRRICYDRDNETCQWSGCGFTHSGGATLNLHHILPEQFGGRETPDNLITLCDIHHKNMHAEFHAFYPDSQSVLYRMNILTRSALSKIRRLLQVDDGNDLRPYLLYLTGKSEFRPGQLKTIRTALAGKSILFVTPTGSGKSVCYQLPGLLGAEPSIVISPLKALMKDQVESIWSKKIPTTYINSDLSSSEKKRRFDFITQGLYKFIFVAPERFESRDPQTTSLYNKYSYLVVDEAHEIEMWGMAFRPAYRKLGQLRMRLGNPPVIALTATASKSTQQHILESLNAEDAEVIVTGFYRDNIYITIYRTDEFDENGTPPMGKYAYIRKVMRRNPGEKILIFVSTVNSGEELLNHLRKEAIDAEFYHGKVDAKDKMRIQNKFTGLEQPELNVLISTSAFGMGIDIPNIRHVIHLAPPSSVTDYTQQIGRAGRDGDQSYAYLLYEHADVRLLTFMTELPLKQPGFKEKHGYSDADVAQVKEKLRQQVADMVALAERPKGSEWDYILEYFGETQPTFWDRKGRLIVDLILCGVAIIITAYIVNIAILN